MAVGGMLIIGTRYAAEQIEVTPRLWLSPGQRTRLLAVADDVSKYGRDHWRGWQFESGLGWLVEVRLRQWPFPRLRASSTISCLRSSGIDAVWV